MSISNTIQ